MINVKVFIKVPARNIGYIEEFTVSDLENAEKEVIWQIRMKNANARCVTENLGEGYDTEIEFDGFVRDSKGNIQARYQQDNMNSREYKEIVKEKLREIEHEIDGMYDKMWVELNNEINKLLAKL